MQGQELHVPISWQSGSQLQRQEIYWYTLAVTGISTAQIKYPFCDAQHTIRCVEMCLFCGIHS